MDLNYECKRDLSPMFKASRCRCLTPSREVLCSTFRLKCTRRSVPLSCSHSCWNSLSLRISRAFSSSVVAKYVLSFREKSVRDHYISERLRFNGQDTPVTIDAERLTIV